MTPRERSLFWAKVRKSDGDGCWEWTASTARAGYGKFAVNRVAKAAHRLAYEDIHGPLPSSVYLCHHCDNPLCVRPSHLFAGSQRDNIRDMVAKGRHGNHKLTPEDARQIRCLIALGVESSWIKRTYNIHKSTLSHVKVGRTHAGGDK